MNEPVHTGRWLLAVDAHPETVDTDLVVATAMANEGVIGLEALEGVSEEDVCSSVEELLALGFLESTAVLDHGGGREEHLLRLRFPGHPA